MLAGDERSLQTDLVRGDRIVPVTGCVGSRNPCSSAPAQRATPQVSETVGVRLYRPPGICWSLSAVSWRIGCADNSQAGDGDPLASRWFPRLLALEIPDARWTADDSSRRPPAHTRYEHREPTLGGSTNPR